MMSIIAFIVCTAGVVICASNGHMGLAMFNGMLAALNLILFLGTR